MKDDLKIRLGVGAAVSLVVVWLTLIIYVAQHFIRKYW